MSWVGTPSTCRPGTAASLSQVSIVPPVPSILNSTQFHVFTGSGADRATPAGLCSGSVASSEARLNCSAPFCPPNRRSRLPSAASAMATAVVCEAGRAVVCRTQYRTYQTSTPDAMPIIWLLRTKTWLQYPAAPFTRGEVDPLWATVRSIVAVPAPEQSGYVTDQVPP